MSSTSLAAESRLAIFVLLALFMAPYTKVEESFNLQATHDIITHGLPVGNPFSPSVSEHLAAHYDHVEFSGAVPRTFVGALALSAVAKPFSGFLSNPDRQLLVRAILGLWNAFCIARFSRAVRRLFGDLAGTFFLMFTSCQFHVVYYASRTLPNFLAFGVVTLAQADLMLGLFDDRAQPAERSRKLQHALFAMTIMGIIFRSELAVLLAISTALSLFSGRLSLIQITMTGVFGLVVGLGLTVGVDSLFWQKLVWPELNAFIFNVIEGKSEEWGVSPFYHYFAIALPKLLFNPTTFLVCIPWALFRDVSSRTRTILGSSLAYVAILSFQGHKEWRFIIYVLPPLTAVAAAGADLLWKTRAKGGRMQALVSTAVLMSVPLSLVATFAFVAISSLSYPGGHALERVHAISDHQTSGTTVVHMNVMSCMTGVTRFLQVPPSGAAARPDWAHPNVTWKYDKTEVPEDLLKASLWESFDFVIVEDAHETVGSWEPVPEVGQITAYSGFVFTKSRAELQRQLQNAELAVGAPGRFADVGRNLVKYWNLLGTSLSGLTSGRWLTIRLEPKLQVLQPARSAL